MTQIFNQTSEKEKRRKLRKESPQAERLLWYRLRNRQLLGCRFRRQYSVGAYVLDFYCPQLRLAIEIDGDSHFQPGSPEYDEQRQREIEALGVRFLRFRNDQVFENLDGVLECIAEIVRELSDPL